MNVSGSKKKIANPVISVVVAAYNNNEYLEKCLSSLLNQTYRPMEVILIDDNSKIQITRTILNFKSKADSYMVVKYIKNKTNLGYYWNTEKGLKKVTGKYVTLLQHDDWYTDKHMLAKSILYLESHPNTFVAVSNSTEEFSNKRSSQFVCSIDFEQFNGRRILSRNLYRDLNPSYSGIVANFEELKNLGYMNYFVKKNDARMYGLNPDEGYFALGILLDAGNVAISSKSMSVRGMPVSQHHKSASWRSGAKFTVIYSWYRFYLYFKKNKSIPGLSFVLKGVSSNSPINFTTLKKAIHIFDKKFSIFVFLILFIQYPRELANKIMRKIRYGANR
jgi:glycosyltransferase involved in cell wall biosynthesis